jgi:hypothetical protein
MTRLLLTSGRGPAECRIALAKVLEALAQEARALLVGLGYSTMPARWAAP